MTHASAAAPRPRTAPGSHRPVPPRARSPPARRDGSARALLRPVRRSVRRPCTSRRSCTRPTTASSPIHRDGAGPDRADGDLRPSGQLRTRPCTTDVHRPRSAGWPCSASCRCRSCWHSRSRWPCSSTPSRREAGASSASTSFIPYAVPGVVAALVWSFMYSPTSSPINRLLEPLAVTVPFFNEDLVLWSVANIVTWSWTGYNMIIIYAALQSIPAEVLEAARIDGASRCGPPGASRSRWCGRRAGAHHGVLDHRLGAAVQRADRPASRSPGSISSRSPL